MKFSRAPSACRLTFPFFFSLWLRLYFSPHTERLRQSLIRAELTGNAALPDRFNRSRPQDQMTAAAKGTAKKAIGLIRKTITARAAHFFVHFFTVTARLRREKAQFHVLWRT